MKNRIVIKFASFCIIILGLIISCTVNEDDNEIIQVKYGTSFGECIGYCNRDLSLNAGFVTYNRSGWVDTIETITFTDILGECSWNYFKKELPINSFLRLPSVVSCPDCADGGAEWIEIELANGVKHKVSFEYYNEPAVVKYYVVRLRDIMNAYNQRGV